MNDSTRSARPLDLLARAYRTAASALGLPPGGFPYNGQIRWAIGFVVACTLLVGGMLLLLWALSGFGSLGVSGHGLVALVLGTLFTTALGVGLMALTFYSDRSDDSDARGRSDTDAEHNAE